MTPSASHYCRAPRMTVSQFERRQNRKPAMCRAVKLQVIADRLAMLKKVAQVKRDLPKQGELAI